LGEFAKSQADAHNVKTAAHSAVSHDPSVDLDPTLLKAAATIEADLIVMQSHIPGLADHLWPSNGGKIARQAKCSVMIVRD
jgi:nucleotide-binding universal stress UspA family protein